MISSIQEQASLYPPPNPRTVKVALYARVSKADDSQDPENQVRHLREFAEDEDLEVHDEYIDRASGADPNRPELERLLEDARTRKFSLILAVKLDRIARSMPNFYRILEQLMLCNVQLHCVDQPEISTRTSQGRFMMAIIGAVAEYERELIRERTIAGLEGAKADGRILGRPKLKVDATEVLALLDRGKSYEEIAEELGISVGTAYSRSKKEGGDFSKEKPSKKHLQ